jgi:two-component system KDP operon response regulator KdpE
MTETGLRILVVDDEKPIRRFLRAILSAQGYYFLEASDGSEAIRMLAMDHPDVIILDLGLPDVDGLEVIRLIREWSGIPIIVLSVKEQEEVKVRALDAGADDYLTKPFGVMELLARLRVVMRRSVPLTVEPVFETGELKVDFSQRQVFLGSDEVNLTPLEYDILKALVQNAGRVLTHRQILKNVWGEGYEDDFHLLRVTVSHMRKKIERNPAQPQYIHTEPGVGYRLRIDLDE